jgi:pimeloyl-ACP methyl ester carboxylesterase
MGRSWAPGLPPGWVSGLPPVLVVPGMGEGADEYAWLLGRLGDRRVLVADVRGRGRSDAPPAGYAWEDHIGDLRAVVAARALEPPVLVAFSRGSSYALGYALHFPDQVRGLVVGDYQARHVGLPGVAAS